MNQYEQTMLDNARKEYADSLDQYDTIRSPGKFENEHVSAVALWAIGCEGFADVDSTDCDGTPYYEFFFSRSELADYGLESYASDDIDSYYVVLVESEQGFVSLSVNTSPVGDDCDDSDYDDDPPCDCDECRAETAAWVESLSQPEYIYPQPERTFSQGEETRTIAITDSVRVRIQWEYDNDADFSWVGELSDSRDSWVFDRKEGVLLGEYETITKHLPPKRAELWRDEMEALGYDVEEYDSPMRGWLELEASGYKVVRDNLGRGMSYEYDHNSYRYLKVGVDQGYNPPKDEEEIGYLLQDREYVEDTLSGSRWFVGVSAALIVDGLEIADSGGLWGIDCEMTDSTKREYESEQIHEFIATIQAEAQRLERAAITLKTLDPQTILASCEEIDE